MGNQSEVEMTKERSALWTNWFYRSVDPQVGAVGYHRAHPDSSYIPSRTLMPDFDLWYVTAGKGSVKISDEWTEFAGGDLVTILPGEHYQEDRADAADPYVVYYVHMLPFGDDPQGLGEELARQWPRQMSLMGQPAVAPVFAELFATFTTRPEAYQMRLKALALRVLENVFHVLRHHSDAAGLPPAYPRLLEARDYITRYNRRDLSLQEVADHVGLSPSYVSALFRRYLGCSPMQYQTRQRLRMARRHLAEGMSVSRVAEQVGFHSIHYFSRVFRKHEGRTPTDFAKSCWRK
jgi:AraC-like DNA-binding protein